MDTNQHTVGASHRGAVDGTRGGSPARSCASRRVPIADALLIAQMRVGLRDASFNLY